MNKPTKEEKLTILIGLLPYVAELLEELHFAHNVKQDVKRVIKHFYKIGEIVTDPKAISVNVEETHEQYHNLYVFLSELIEKEFIKTTRQAPD